MRHLRRNSNALRLFGASVSLAITIGMFFLLRAAQPAFEARGAERQVAVSLIQAKPAPVETAPTSPAPRKAEASSRSPAAPPTRGVSTSPLPRPETSPLPSGASIPVPAEPWPKNLR